MFTWEDLENTTQPGKPDIAMGRAASDGRHAISPFVSKLNMVKNQVKVKKYPGDMEFLVHARY